MSRSGDLCQIIMPCMSCPLYCLHIACSICAVPDSNTTNVTLTCPTHYAPLYCLPIACSSRTIPHSNTTNVMLTCPTH